MENMIERFKREANLKAVLSKKAIDDAKKKRKNC